MKRHFAALAAAFLFAAAPPPAVSTNPATVQAGTYKVESSHTRVQFTVSHLGFTDWWGDFSGVTGMLNLDPARPAASRVDIAIPVASVSTTNATLDGELRSADWFDAGRYPSIRFVSTRIVRTGPTKAAISGKLSFHGVTRPVTLDARFVGSGPNPMTKAYTIGFNATTTIRRSDYGVKMDIPLVGDETIIRISAAFEKAS
ncbi:MAG TPA: YceI family protein [Allosphingosinicella sp.]|jgi:polyisoprenoid-binding protein YceI